MTNPHRPSPEVVTESDYRLLLEESGQLRSRQAVVDASDRPLYDLLMEVLEAADAHCPDLMPAALAEHCTDLVHVRDTVSDVDRGLLELDGYGSYGLSYCKSVREAIVEWRDRDPLRLVVVGCSASKHDVDEAVPAADLYRGAYWSCKREYATTVADEWRILSAKHGLLHPADVIEHYNRSVRDLEHVPVQADRSFRLPGGGHVRTKLDQWAAELYNDLAWWLIGAGAHGSVDPRDIELEVLLGRQYRDPLEERGVFDRLRGRGALSVSFPFQEQPQAQGGNGNQMSWLTDQVEAATPAVTDGGAKYE